MGQFQNKTEAQKRKEGIFTIPAGERESNSVNCEGRSLIAANILQNIESEFLEVLGSEDDELFFPITSRYEEVLEMKVLNTPWNLNNSYSPAQLNVNSTTGSSPQGLEISPNGENMYTVDLNGDKINQYLLPAPFDVSTAQLVKTLDVSDYETQLRDVFIKPDGSQILIIGADSDKIHSFRLQEEWDVETAVFINSKDVSAQDTTPTSLYISNDGANLFITGLVNNKVFAYTLSTPWNISSATYIAELNVSAKETSLRSCFFKPDGTKLYITGAISDSIHSYTLTTAWDLTTASFTATSELSFKISAPNSIVFNPDGNQVFIVDDGKDLIISGALSTEWDITTLDLSFILNTTSKETTPRGVIIKPDGSMIFIVGTGSDSIHSYNLSTVFNLNSASFSSTLDVSSQDSNPEDIYISADGINLYILGNFNKTVYSYELSTAWDITTASAVDSFSVNAHEIDPSALFFSDDGKYMFVAGRVNKTVYRFSLSTAWDISTATLDDELDASNLLNEPTGITFKEGGLELYISDLAEEKTFVFDLKNAWNLSEAIYSPNKTTPSIKSVGNISISNDGKNIYAITSDPNITQYKLNRSSWISIDIPEITAPYQYLKMRSSHAESGERTIKAILRQEA